MTPLRGEYRIRQHPDIPGKLLVTWRAGDVSPVWVHVAVVDDLHQASEAMVEHRDKGWT